MKRMFVRNCKVGVVPECRVTFRTRYKRTRACPECAKRLKLIRLSVRRYEGMADDNYTERVEWTSSEQGVMTYVETEEHRDSKTGAVIGKSDSTRTIQVKKSDLLANLDIQKGLLDKAGKQKADLQRKLEGMPKRQMFTKAMDDIRKTLDAIRTNTNLDQVETQIKSLEQEEETIKARIRKREATLKTAPVVNDGTI
jgi:hypothetical protein